MDQQTESQAQTAQKVGEALVEASRDGGPASKALEEVANAVRTAGGGCTGKAQVVADGLQAASSTWAASEVRSSTWVKLHAIGVPNVYVLSDSNQHLHCCESSLS